MSEHSSKDNAATESLPAAAIAVHRRGIEQNRQIALVLIHRDGFLVEHLAEDCPIVVGRDEPASVRLQDSTLSRTHAQFCLVKDKVRVQDLDSTNGTWANGKRIQAAMVSVGDEIMLGGVLARIQVIGALYSEFDVDDNHSDMVVGPVMHELLKTARQVADSRIPVILHGETGTGKEILARFIHEHGPRQQQTLVSVNCAAISAQLVESILFGHERGAFTGAIQTKKGIFEVADGGTVFLDEIGELPLETQAVLLRVLESGTFVRVGATDEIRSDVRVIAATHRDLERMVAAGEFRADLFYRLNTMILRIPPLRDRKDEIEPLAIRFLQRANHANRRSVTAISPEALDALRAYDWPGNVRELYNAIERAVVVSTTDRIEDRDLPDAVRAAGQARTASAGSPKRASAPPDVSTPPITSAPPRPAGTPMTVASASDSIASENDAQIIDIAEADDDASQSAPAGDYRARLQSYETAMLREALDACNWNRTEAARRLGMSLRTLRYKMKAFGLTDPVD